MKRIEDAGRDGRVLLSEYASKQMLAENGIPITREVLVTDAADLARAVRGIGFPIVMKGCSSTTAHKTEKGLVRIDIRDEAEARAAFAEILPQVEGEGKGVLVQEMITGKRELVMGLTRDPQFGPCVMFGLGGIFTEILKDISFRVAPIEKRDALEMMEEIRGHRILGPVRGMPAADLDALADMLIRLGRIGMENEQIREIDLNPVILSDERPVAVDALVVLDGDVS